MNAYHPAALRPAPARRRGGRPLRAAAGHADRRHRCSSPSPRCCARWRRACTLPRRPRAAGTRRGHAAAEQPGDIERLVRGRGEGPRGRHLGGGGRDRAARSRPCSAAGWSMASAGASSSSSTCRSPPGAIVLGWLYVPESGNENGRRPTGRAPLLATIGLGALTWGLTAWSATGTSARRWRRRSAPASRCSRPSSSRRAPARRRGDGAARPCSARAPSSA